MPLRHFLGQVSDLRKKGTWGQSSFFKKNLSTAALQQAPRAFHQCLARWECALSTRESPSLPGELCCEFTALWPSQCKSGTSCDPTTAPCELRKHAVEARWSRICRLARGSLGLVPTPTPYSHVKSSPPPSLHTVIRTISRPSRRLNPPRYDGKHKSCLGFDALGVSRRRLPSPQCSSPSPQLPLSDEESRIFGRH